MARTVSPHVVIYSHGAHSAYQHIIGMGWDAVPLMLRELRDDPDPDHWFSALEAITEADPVPEEQWGNIKAMAAAWVEWGEREGCI